MKTLQTLVRRALDELCTAIDGFKNLCTKEVLDPHGREDLLSALRHQLDIITERRQFLDNAGAVSRVVSLDGGVSEVLGNFDYVAAHIEIESLFRSVTERSATSKDAFRMATFSQVVLQKNEHLYESVLATVRCSTDGEGLGIPIGAAFSLLKENSAEVRRGGWECLERGLSSREELFSQVLNGTVAARTFRHCSSPKDGEVDLSELPPSYKISNKATTAVRRALALTNVLAVEGYQACARVAGVRRLHVSDLFWSPQSESTQKTSSEDALEIIRDAVGEVCPELSDVIHSLHLKGNLHLAAKAAGPWGASCFDMRPYEAPCVVMDFGGTVSDVVILAHELGHAVHNVVVSELPFSRFGYGSCLGETMSIFLEKIVISHLVEKASSKVERVKVLWTLVRDGARYLTEFPLRDEVESAIMLHPNAGNISAQEYVEIASSAWDAWMGDSIGGVDNLLWISRSHFYRANHPFCHLPYSIGYLLSSRLFEVVRELPESEVYEFLIDFMRATYTVGVDDIVEHFFGKDPTHTPTWEGFTDPYRELVFTLAREGEAVLDYSS